MENGPFTDDFPIKASIYKGFSIAMLNNQRVLVISWFLDPMIVHDSSSLVNYGSLIQG